MLSGEIMGKGYRTKRLGEEIKRIISQLLLTEIKDPRLAGKFISITDVEVTSDGSYATCYVTVMSCTQGDRNIDIDDEQKSKDEKTEVIDGLKRAAGLMRTEISKKLSIRHVPELIFKIDSSMEYGNHIEKVIRELGEKNEK